MLEVLLRACSGGRAARPFLRGLWNNVLSRPFTESHTFSRARAKPKFSPTIVIIGFIPIFTFGLGTWQVRRRQWKLDLIKQLNDQLEREPLELPDFVNVNILSEFDFRRFVVKGEWDHARSVLVGPKSRDGELGYEVITPLVRDGASTILVDRGFVSKKFVSADRRVRNYHQPKGEVEVLGMLRTQLYKKNVFTPENKPEKGEWYWIDIAGIKEWVGGDERNVQNVFLEGVFDGNTGEVSDLLSKGIPVGRPSQIELRNMHATYALTWYSLSAATALMFIGLLRRRQKPLTMFRL